MAAAWSQGLGGTAAVVAGAGGWRWHAVTNSARGGAPVVAGAEQAPAPGDPALPGTDRWPPAAGSPNAAVTVQHVVGGHGTGGGASRPRTTTCRTTACRIPAYRAVQRGRLSM
ncbi:hypothetical protein WR25_09836 [Diploscapter pachys]|uniref:Uncharacterized protein n=1 Tax=Diploscapter pachys TaxID=2018661 RepID=A0A2A2KAE6_9BILA|nr:hypothetical protein WR25_09836 [Diploscapter pachys]